MRPPFCMVRAYALAATRLAAPGAAPGQAASRFQPAAAAQCQPTGMKPASPLFAAPPAVTAARPVKMKTCMDAVWIEGTLELAQTKTEMGNPGYRMRAARIEACVEKKTR